MGDEEQKVVMGSRSSSETESTNFELTIDEVIEDYVGAFGLSQMLNVLLVSLAWIFDAHSTLVTIFSDAQPPGWRCKTGSCPSDHTHSSSTHNSASISNVCGLVPGSWEWVNGRTSSTIAEWNLVCDRKFLAAIPASFFFLGSLIGSGVFGHLADSWLGRKRTVFVSCILTSITFLLTSFSPNVWVYALLRFANGFARSGIGISCIVLSTEAVGKKWRGQVSQYGFFLFTVGFLSLPVIAYPTRTHWRNLYRFLSIPPLSYAVLLLPFVSESPRWFLVRGRSQEALAVLNRLARLNGKASIPNNVTLAKPSATSEIAAAAAEDKGESLWRTKWAAKRMAIVMLAGFGVGFVYYGVQLNVENLNISFYITVFINGLMEIPAVFIGSFFMGFSNRRLLFSVSAYIAGIACILCTLFSHKGGRDRGSMASKSKAPFNGNWGQLLVEAIGFLGASLAFDILYGYSVELFPTNVRNFAVSMMRQAVMLGASMAPLLVVVGRLSPSLSYFVFGGLSLFSGVLTLWLPDTRNAPLYETLKQQQEQEKQIQLSKQSAV
ncbi:hypothetical protein L6164_006321 [Bauhinia variegata]|uniref:Uncharacterized protein n=1 Tax=Bauhinia variegata TaxID=167791 RepID=A0ACB9PU41_BAUVA|nr:hypothetical protein L6164_006321 [Bauhinia variegata]